MSENILTNVNCNCSEGGACECDLTQLHMSCTQDRTEVYETLPASGAEGTVYYVGNNTDGYTTYVWSNASGFVELGEARGTLIQTMTTSNLGVGKISTASVLTRGSVVGMNADFQLMVPPATRFAYGSVLLGSVYMPNHASPYCVGIGASGNASTYGQLCFNLAEKQPTESGWLEDTPGCLRYRLKPGTSASDNTAQYEMYVTTGTIDQLGVVKLCSAYPTGGTDEENDAAAEEMRHTHAASVGMVLDGISAATQDYLTDTRIFGYFDRWAKGRALGEEIWTNYQGVLLSSVSSRVVTDSRFESICFSAAGIKAEAWFTEHITDAYMVELFGGRIDKLAEDYWTEDIDATIDEIATATISENFQSELIKCLEVPANVTAVSKLIAAQSKALLLEDKDEIVTDYVADVLSGRVPISIGGASSAPEFIESKIEVLVEQALGAVNARIAAAEDKLNAFRNHSLAAKTLGTITESGGTLPACGSYDYIELSTNKGSCFVIPVWEVKRAFEDGKAYSFVDVWGEHDDDVEYDGAQLRITSGWKFSEDSAYTSAFPMTVRGLTYVFNH